MCLILINPCPAELGYIIFENNVDPEQLASNKPPDHDPHRFPLILKIHAYNWNVVQPDRIGEECSTKNI